MTIAEALDHVGAWSTDWKNPAWKEYLLTGEKRWLQQLPKMKHWHLPQELVAALQPAGSSDPSTRRMLEAFAAAKFERALGQWLAKSLSADNLQDTYDQGREVLRELGCWPTTISYLTAYHVRPLLRPDGKITNAGAALCKLASDDLLAVVNRISRDHEHELHHVAPVLAVHAPATLEAVLNTRLEKRELLGLSCPFWKVLLEKDRCRFEPLAVRAFQCHEDSWTCFQIGRELAGLDSSNTRPRWRSEP